MFNSGDVDMISACGTNVTMVITPGNNTDIYSPNYPETYPDSLYCKWHIMAPDNIKIDLFIKGDRLEEK